MELLTTTSTSKTTEFQDFYLVAVALVTVRCYYLFSSTLIDPYHCLRADLNQLRSDECS